MSKIADAVARGRAAHAAAEAAKREAAETAKREAAARKAAYLQKLREVWAKEELPKLLEEAAASGLKEAHLGFDQDEKAQVCRELGLQIRASWCEASRDIDFPMPAGNVYYVVLP